MRANVVCCFMRFHIRERNRSDSYGQHVSVVPDERRYHPMIVRHPIHVSRDDVYV